MNVKEAIAVLKGYETPAAIVVISALQDSQKREREMFKAMSPECQNRSIHKWDGKLMCFLKDEKGIKCTKRKCLLLKGGGN